MTVSLYFLFPPPKYFLSAPPHRFGPSRVGVRGAMKLKHEKWYEQGKEISGVSADNPVMMMGTVVFEFSHEGRSFDLEFGVLKGGDTGSADVTVGNYVLRSDRYDGAVDVGAGVVTLRKVDSRG